GKPSTSEAGFSLSQTLTLSQHGLGRLPQDPASGFGRHHPMLFSVRVWEYERVRIHKKVRPVFPKNTPYFF
ncbi:MAG: hypothetical protein K2I74_00345, partial [Treponemataceae bacterium]|nr:hypothetical protein [Treponemataceae bacterium]